MGWSSPSSPPSGPLLSSLLAVLVACEQPVIPRVGVPTLDDPGAGTFASVSAGLEHTCALTSDGTAYCWGSNEFGQLGVAADTTCRRSDRLVACRLRPAPVTGGLKFTALSAGGRHTCGISTAGDTYCWGDNLRGGLGDPTIRSSLAPTLVAGMQSLVGVVTGREHTCALRGDGFAFCWGANESGQLGIQTVGLGTAVPDSVRTNLRFFSLVAGADRTCGRSTNGGTYCWGSSWLASLNGMDLTRSQSSPVRVQPAPTFKSLTAGTTTNCGIAAQGATSDENAAYCWEGNIAGGMGDGTVVGSSTPRLVLGEIRFVAIASGAFHTCAIADSGFAYCWGGDTLGQLGISSVFTKSRCGAANVPCITKPVRVSGWRVFSQLTAGEGDHTCGLTINGNIYCWGAGGMGQRGDGRATSGDWSPVRTSAPKSL